MDTRSLALGLAANRILFGAGFILSPEKAAKSWIGPVAATGGGGVMVRAAGARDVALGAGALAALRGYADPRPWLAAHLVSDATDVVATWAARRARPRSQPVRDHGGRCLYSGSGHIPGRTRQEAAPPSCRRIVMTFHLRANRGPA